MSRTEFECDIRILTRIKEGNFDELVCILNIDVFYVFSRRLLGRRQYLIEEAHAIS